MANRTGTPEHIAYSKAAERVRRGDDSAAALAALRNAEAAYRATLSPPEPTKLGWWNLPIAKAMWEGDARQFRA